LHEHDRCHNPEREVTRKAECNGHARFDAAGLKTS
jgi:hypothetical protein